MRLYVKTNFPHIQKIPLHQIRALSRPNTTDQELTMHPIFFRSVMRLAMQINCVYRESEVMPIRYIVKEVAISRGFQNARELADAAGISYSASYGLWDNTSRSIHRDTLTEVCRTLGVQPGMLLIYEPDRGAGPPVPPESVRAPRFNRRARGTADRKSALPVGRKAR
jgi:DNA-binding Xre family transcriptional regulator